MGRGYTFGMDAVGNRAGGWRQGCAALLGVMLLPIVMGYGIMARYAVNMPYIDDYPTILGFCVKYEGMHGTGARWHYILADQWVEYKLVCIHLISAAELALTHHVSFSLLFWVGNLSLLPLLYLVWRAYFMGEADVRRRLALFLPMVFLLFSMNYGEALDWTATSLGYIGTLTLALGSIQLLVPGEGRGERWRRAGACLCALVACLIAANAFLLAPIGLFLLLPRRAYGWAVAWCGAFGVALLPYFISFVRDVRFGHGSALLIPVFFFSFLGSALQYVRLAAPMGVVIAIIFVTAVRTGFWRTHPAATLGMGWLIVSAGLAAVGRGRTGLAFSVVSRYRIYSDLLLIFCYGYLAEWGVRASVTVAGKRRLYAGALAAAVVLSVHGEYQAANILKGRRGLLLAGAAYYQAAPRDHSPMHFANEATDASFAEQERDARAWVEAAERMGLYRLPDGDGR